MSEEPSLVSSLVPAIEEQLQSPATPFVATTYHRLVHQESIEEDEAKLMMALCLADESNKMYTHRRDFDIQRYQELLNKLPELTEESN